MRLILFGLLFWVTAMPLQADSEPRWLTDKVYKSVVPGAIYAGPLTEDPPVAAIYGAGALLGYAFETSAIVETVGFSGAPFSIVVGLDLDGVISGVSVVEHSEPILNYGDNDGQIDRFVGQYKGFNYTDRIRLAAAGQSGEIDGISSATISARAFNRAIVQSARIVALSLGFASGERDTAMVDTLRYESLDWLEMIETGALQGFSFDRQTDTDSTNNTPKEKPADFYVALITPTSIGRNLVSRGLYKNFVSQQNASDLIMLVMSNGSASIVGTRVFDTGVFDRIRVSQDGQTHSLVRQKNRYRYVPFLIADGAPSFSEMSIFRVPAENGIDVLRRWELVISLPNVNTAEAPLDEYTFSYHLPSRFVLPATEPRVTTPEKSSVQMAWQAQQGNLIILVLALILLTLLLFFMGPLTRRPLFYSLTRTAFLLFSLLWIGWIVGAQLSVINPIAWIQAFSVSKDLNMFLSDPLLVLLTIYVLISFIVWGRGVFCGWLCPFGALQELLAGMARRLKLPQVSLSYATQKYLWPVKYVVLATVVVSALHAPTTLGAAAEIEPFKTAISLKFDRSWPFVSYALGILVVGLFIERAYCRFVCPLGAIMAIGGKLRLHNPLERRTECGSPCQLCSHRCPVQAITQTGQIKMDECFYCLDCQVIYYDDLSCPPLINKHKRQPESRTLTYHPRL